LSRDSDRYYSDYSDDYYDYLMNFSRFNISETQISCIVALQDTRMPSLGAHLSGRGAGAGAGAFF
jgi:hypothetical protein